MLILPSKTTLSAAARKKSGGGSGDPYFANVSLLLHFNAANGSTTFTDSSSNAFVGSRGGDAVISTTQSKFGGSSLYLDGFQDRITYSDNAAFQFGTGNFTIEAWFYFNSVSETTKTLVAANTTSTSSLFVAHHPSSGWYVGTTGSGGFLIPNVFSSTGAWGHIAVTRASGNVRMFLNGSQIGGTVSNSTSFSLSNGFMEIGTYKNSDAWNGYIDDFRITKGVARYTANFTPPTAQFPDS